MSAPLITWYGFAPEHTGLQRVPPTALAAGIVALCVMPPSIAAILSAPPAPEGGNAA